MHAVSCKENIYFKHSFKIVGAPIRLELNFSKCYRWRAYGIFDVLGMVLVAAVDVKLVIRVVIQLAMVSIVFAAVK